MLYELREYTAVPGRMPALIERFNKDTVPLLEKHGMDLVLLTRTEFGAESKNEIVYLLRFASYQELEDKWSAFLADPAWQEVAARTERDGPLLTSVRRRLLTTAEFPLSP